LPPTQHLRDALVQLNQIGGRGRREVIATLGGVVSGLQFPIRGKRVSQKLQRLLVTTSQESLTDVEHHGERGVVHVLRHFAIAQKSWLFQQGSHSIALLLRSLPDTQIFETVDATHASG
jgi:hypothetical protein